MSTYIRITVYRTLTGLSCHVEEMLGGMPRPKVVRRREWNFEASHGTPSWGTALAWASKVMAAESRRLGASPPPPEPPSRRPPGGATGGSGDSTLNLDLNP